MKKADLEKLKGRKLAGAGTTPDRFGKGAAAVLDKREQREREREMGLVAFAVKLHFELVRELHDAAQKRGVGLNELTADLLKKGLAAK
ncbi:MAG TPA: hypothetical protein VII36_07030 [Usitatibacter sp.]